MHGQIVAAVLGSTVSQVRIVQADTDCTGYDTSLRQRWHGRGRKRGSGWPPRRCANACWTSRRNITASAVIPWSGAQRRALQRHPGAACRLFSCRPASRRQLEAVARLTEPHAASRSRSRLSHRRAPRHGRDRHLYSVHGADGGVIINPMQCRAQVEGAVAQGLGWSLYEKMVFDDAGRIINPTFRVITASRLSPIFRIPRCISPTRTTPSVRSARNP